MIEVPKALGWDGPLAKGSHIRATVGLARVIHNAGAGLLERYVQSKNYAPFFS